MARGQLPNEARSEGDGPERERAATPQNGSAAGESQIRGEEIYRMAAFRIRETANRIATLANSARDPGLRSQLRIVCDRLLEQEHALLALSDR